MAGSETYQIKRCQKFDSSYAHLVKRHYRRNKRELDKFEELIDEFVTGLATNPCPDDSSRESFPGNSAGEGLELRKKRWQRLPGLQGSARYGRLFYIIDHIRKCVHLLWIYTHAEYGEPKSQPPQKELAREINIVKQEIQASKQAK